MAFELRKRMSEVG